MAAGRFVVPPYFPARDRDFNLLSGALLYVYQNETTTKANIYTDEALTVLSSNPVVANSSGQFPAVYAEAGTEASPVLYSVSVTTSTGASPGNPFNFDNYRPSVDWETAAVALAEAAAEDAALSAAAASVDLASVESIYADILDIEATGSDAAAIAARAKLDGSNFTGGQPAQFRAAIDAVEATALAGTGGGSLVGLSPGGTLQGILTNILYSSQFASINAALTAWMTAGGTLVIDRDYTITTAFTTSDGVFLAGQSYLLTTQGARTITYNGSNVATVWRLYLAGQNELVFDGDLTLNCQDKAATGFFLDGTGVSGTDRRDCILRGLKVKNCRMTVALATSLGANGIVVRGGFNLLHMDTVRVDDITRQALSGSIGSYGTTGIQYFGNAGTTSNAKRILLENFEVNNIESEDTVNTAAFTDMDGVLIFQYKVGTDDVQAPIIRNGYLTECLGRGVKRYATAFGGETSNLTLRRSQIGRFEGPQEVVHQDASGAIRDIEIIYSDAAHNSTVPTIPIGLSLIASLDNGGATVERVSIRDSTGVAKAAVINLFMSATDSFRRQFSFKNIKDTGTAVTFVRPGAIASVSDCYINMENINVSLTSAVALTEDNMFYLKAVANGFVNRGSTVPAVRNDAGVMKGLRWGDWWGDDGTVGVTRYFPVWRGNPAFSNGFRGPGGGCVDAPAYGECEVFGRTPLPSYTVAASGGLWEIAPFGSYQDKGGDYTVKINRRDVSTFPAFTLSTTFNSTALAVLTGAVPSGWDVRSGGSPSGGGTNIEVWKDSTTQALRITNYSGVDAVLDLVFNP